jgi:hypothetical protein
MLYSHHIAFITIHENRWVVYPMKKSFLATLFLLLIFGLAAGCNGLRLPGRPVGETDSLAPYRAAMAPSQQALLDTLPPMPAYRIEVRVDPTELRLAGRETLRLPPQPDGAVPKEFYFRLYPLLPHYNGSVGVDLVTVNGHGAPFSYEASDTAIKIVTPPDAVQPGDPITIGIQWRVKAQEFPEDTYHLFGSSGGVFSLPLFYPVLAVRDPDAPDQWRLDIGQLQGDSAYAQAATYQVDVTAPPGYVVVSTGSVIDVHDAPQPTPEPEAGDAGDESPQPTPLSPPWKTWRIVSGPAREFAMFLSSQLRQAQTYAGDVRINSWHRPGDEVTGRAAADYAAAALRIYGELFGPYPYAELDVVAGPLTFRGMEYPGLFELGYQLYRDYADELEFRVAHEMAHQWWYNQVGSDPVNTPWLDEGLAEFSTYFYTQKVYGTAAADRMANRRWQGAYEFYRERGQDAVVNQPVDAFQANYEAMVYGKAALFHYALMQAMGEPAYLDLVRQYAATYRFKEATPDDFLQLAEAKAGPVARELYDQWILGSDNPATSEDSTDVQATEVISQ